jgi:hypothetical protein
VIDPAIHLQIDGEELRARALFGCHAATTTKFQSLDADLVGHKALSKILF